jgi:hypothetical protein
MIVLTEILSPVEEKHSIGTSTNPDWASPETAQLMIAAFDVMLANSATEATRAGNEYERLSLLRMKKCHKTPKSRPARHTIRGGKSCGSILITPQ